MILKKVLKNLKMNKSYLNLITIVLPIFLSAIYVFFIAEDRFISESKFTIKSDSESSSQLDFSMLGASSSGKQDQLIIRDHILSHDMMNKIIEKFSLQALSSKKNDLIWKVDKNTSNIDLFKQYKKLIDLKFNDEGAISQLEVQMFDPILSKKVNEFIIEESIKFVNSFSEELSNQYINFAENDALKAKNKYDQALDLMKEFQDDNSLISPEGDQLILTSTLTTLENQVVTEKNKLSEFQSYLTDETSQVKQQKIKIKNLEDQIEETRKKMASSSDKDLNDTARLYIEKENNVKFAQESYITALSTLEAARLKAMHSQKHLMVIAKPTSPESATMPMRYFNFTIISLLILTLNLLLRSAINIVKEYY